jgi:hypothetical protein
MHDVVVPRFTHRDELLITSPWDTDSFGFSKKDGTYSKLFEDIGFLILNASTRLLPVENVLSVS